MKPYSEKTMRLLKPSPPSTDEPMQILISTTQGLGNILFVGEIVAWQDKRKLDTATRRAISRLIWTFQPREDRLYEHARGIECVNLLFVRRFRRLRQPIAVETLVLRSKGRVIAGKRSTSGGWAYVEPVMSAV